MSIKKQSVYSFLGMSLMMTFTFLYISLLGLLKTTVVVVNESAAIVPFHEILAILVDIITVVLMTWRNVGRAYKVYFPINFLILCIFAFLFNLSPNVSGNHYLGYSFYIWAKLSVVLSYVLIWGFANQIQIYSFTTAFILYPIFVFLFESLGSIAGAMVIVELANNVSLSEYFNPLNISIVALFSLLPFAAFLWMGRDKADPKEKGLDVSWGYLDVSWGYIAAVTSVFFGLEFIGYFLNSIFQGGYTNLSFDLDGYFQAIHLSYIVWFGFVFDSRSCRW